MRRIVLCAQLDSVSRRMLHSHPILSDYRRLSAIIGNYQCLWSLCRVLDLVSHIFRPSLDHQIAYEHGHSSPLSPSM